MRQVLPVVGAAIGAYFGGAQGAQWGWAIGSLVGNAVDPLIIKGPSIGDLATQTSQEGVPRPIVFALSQPIAGNIVACSQPRIVTKRQRQGKGGPVTETQVVYRTYAIAICEGPITGLVRVWSNGKLVYDARPGGSSTNNSKFLQNAVIYLGSFDQMPNSYLEAKFGNATPAMRGTAYIVWHDIDLTAQGGAVPQYVFQVLRCEGEYLTSRPYAAEAVDSLQTDLEPQRVHFQPQPTMRGDTLAVAVAPVGITRYGGQITYATPNEDRLAVALEPVAITRYGGQATYAAPNEDRLATSIEPVAITRYGGQVTYTVPSEGITVGLEPVSITREVP